MTTTVKEIRALMSQYPRLTAHGHGTPPDNGWAEMLAHGFIREVDACRAWLKGATKTQQINPRAGTSYALKHEVEKATGVYTSNGAFIVAALLEGFQIGKGFNPCLNIAKRRRIVGAMHPLPTASTTSFDPPGTRHEP